PGAVSPSPRAVSSSPPRVAERVLAVAAGVLVTATSVLTAVVEAFFVPLRLAGVRVPVVLLLAVLVNLSLPWLGYLLSRSRFVIMLPPLAWFVVIVVFAGGTDEGDVVLAGNDWVALALLLIGSTAAAGGAYFALLRVVPGSLGGMQRRTR
ncbi:MAG: hypothetical protein ACRDT4_08350, partial [Micromonosporaceae bacterium]